MSGEDERDLGGGGGTSGAGGGLSGSGPSGGPSGGADGSGPSSAGGPNSGGLSSAGGGGGDASSPGSGGMGDWPTTDLDPVRRMRVLASALPSGAYAELRVDTPFERVWGYLADLDRSIPDLISFIRRFELHTDGAALATGLLGNRGRFAVDLRDGWCVMQDRFVVGGFAAVADGERTLLAGCGAVRTAGIRRVVPLLFGERAVLRTLGKVRSRVESAGRQ